MRWLTPPGVYRPQGDTALLIKAVAEEHLSPGRAVLDLGTGSGAVAVVAARAGARVTAVDVSWLALVTAWANAWLHRCRVRPRHGDLTAPVAGRRFDLVVSNPPYVPARSPGPPRRGISRAWDAGLDGRLLLDRICREAPALLTQGGVVLLVQSSLADVGRTRALLERSGCRVRVVARRRQVFGPVMSQRAPWFEERGLIAPGDHTEELVVVRGVRLR